MLTPHDVGVACDARLTDTKHEHDHEKCQEVRDSEITRGTMIR